MASASDSTTFGRKIAVMGYPSVGKSSLTVRYVEGHFPETYDTTIEDTYTKSATFHGRQYRLTIVDTAGQQDYSLHPKSCAIVHGYILVYAINSRRSFDILKAIHDRILDTVGDESIPIILVGNKLDLATRQREVATTEGEAMAKDFKAKFLETSAKENRQVDEIFAAMLYEIELAAGNIKPEEKKDKCSIM